MRLIALAPPNDASIWWPNLPTPHGPYYAPYLAVGFLCGCVLFALFALAAWRDQRRAWRV